MVGRPRLKRRVQPYPRACWNGSVNVPRDNRQLGINWPTVADAVAETANFFLWLQILCQNSHPKRGYLNRVGHLQAPLEDSAVARSLPGRIHSHGPIAFSDRLDHQRRQLGWVVELRIDRELRAHIEIAVGSAIDIGCSH